MSKVSRWDRWGGGNAKDMMMTPTTTKTPTTMTTIPSLTGELGRSLRKPTRRTLTLIDKALAWLRPFESSKARTVSVAERQELLDLLAAHRTVLSPYIDTARIEANLRTC